MRNEKFAPKLTSLTLRRYKDFLAAWFQGKLSEFFPMEIHGKKVVSSKADYGELIKQMRLLREESKECRSSGYRVEWRSVNSTRFGKSEFPERVFIDTSEDYFFLTEKKKEFLCIESVATQIRESFPVLERCLSTQLPILSELADRIEPLIAVLTYFQEHPKPDIFLREIPAVGVHTKFIESPKIKKVLRPWLDEILPAWAIRSDEDHFERRYFLRHGENLIRIRLLDPDLQKKLSFPCLDLELPIHSLGDLEIQGIRVIIIENKVPILTLSSLPNTIALGGLGNGVTSLQYAPWLHRCQLYYWGDLDTDGFRILSGFRKTFPAVQSLFMDTTTLEHFKSLLTSGNGRQIDMPPFLNEEEKAAFLRCREENIRLEQERIHEDSFKNDRFFNEFMNIHVDQKD